MKVKSDVIIADKGWEKIKHEMLVLSTVSVMVGVQSGEASGTKGVSLATIAAANEFGTSKIPARPFMRKSFDLNKPKIVEFCQKAIAAVIMGRIGGIQAANLCGQEMTGIIQEEITDGRFTPNAPRTIKKKGSDKPLIDTGRLRQSIRHVVKRTWLAIDRW